MFNCPDCPIDKSKLTEDPCAVCARSKEQVTWTKIFAPFVPTVTPWTDTNTTDPCQNCPNHPKNGGSGVCICSIPYMHGGPRWTVMWASAAGTSIG